MKPMAENEPGISVSGVTERAQVAFHEAGHIVTAETLLPGSIAVATITELDGSLSGTTRSRNARRRVTFDEIERDVHIVLSGGIAVERQFGVPGTGCASDFKAAREAIDSLLIDASFMGSYHIGIERYDESDALEDARERACAAIVESYHWKTKRILALHWNAVERIAEALYRNGYVLSEDIEHAMAA